VSGSLRVLIATDAFPPNCGGSGWSTWELVRGLAARGHDVEVIKAEAGKAAAVVDGRYEGFRVTTFRVAAPDLVVVRNLAKNERLWASLADYLRRDRLARAPSDVIHAQHVMTTVPAVDAGRALGIPVVATVRDYWPVCYWSDLIHDPSQPDLCPECSTRMMARCVRPRAGAATVAAWSVIPYMRANLRRKRRALARASAVIAVSTAIADDLKARAPETAKTSVYTIPNPVDMAALDDAHAAVARPLEEPYALYVGKLATNKGVQFLPSAYAQAGLDWPLVVVGDGPLRASFERESRDLNVDVRMLGWQDRDRVWSWMRHAGVLAFPSFGPESLSRVLLEAAALGVPIAAIETGGTGDILRNGETALLSPSPDAFARDLARLAGDDRLRERLGRLARADVRTRFAAPAVVEQVEQVYRSLLEPEAA
jgi:glycosyltransferase involved in cell wall biosynthesis